MKKKTQVQLVGVFIEKIQNNQYIIRLLGFKNQGDLFLYLIKDKKYITIKLKGEMQNEVQYY